MFIALFDTDTGNRVKLKEWITSYAIRENIDFYVLSFTKHISVQKIRKYAPSVTFAFVSLDCPDGLPVGESLARENPDCLICYYSQRACPLRSLLRSRPFAFLSETLCSELFHRALDSMLQELLQSKGAYCHESRQAVRYYPVRDILYLQSNLKHVTIRTLSALIFDSAHDEDLYAKLSDVALAFDRQGISKAFVRIHKSYLVNLRHIRRVDKRNRQILLISKEELPVSDACYKTAIRKIEEFYSLFPSSQPEWKPLEGASFLK